MDHMSPSLNMSNNDMCTYSGREIALVRLSETTNNLGKTSSVSRGLSFWTNVRAWQLSGRTSVILGKNFFSQLSDWTSGNLVQFRALILMFFGPVYRNKHSLHGFGEKVCLLLTNILIIYLHFPPLEVVSRYSYSQSRVAENYLNLFNLSTNIYKFRLMVKHTFHFLFIPEI